MKDQAQMMNNNNQSNMMMSMGQALPPVMSQPQQQLMVNQSQSQAMLNHRIGGGGYGMWPPPQVEQLKFQNPNLKPPGIPLKPMGPRIGNNKNWKGKKGNDKWINNKVMAGGGGGGGGASSNTGGGGSGGGAYNPPTLNELQQQNRLKARRYFPKKKFNHGGRSAPFAPRNTTSFLIRAKKAGGITSLVSPCPVTPAVLPTPIFSPSREVLVDMAKEEWGVDGYGSMKGLIRLRSGNEADAVEDEEEDEGGSSESDVEEHVEVERRLDHDLSRFEMIYPNYNGADYSSYNLENRVDDQDTHIAQLEEENLILKERLFLMEREFDDLRMRLQCLERQSRGVERLNEEVVENDSENESESSRGYGRSMEENNDEINERSQNSEGNNNGATYATEVKQSDSVEVADINKNLGVSTDVCMEEPADGPADVELKKVNNNGPADVELKKENSDGPAGGNVEKCNVDVGLNTEVGDVSKEELESAKDVNEAQQME
ncbi:uncharacterized protein [Rutidosis leptorrhynchoides]|uniref:uncharacterized protein isoform X2 n=1 Tax=Rutidosis leptorrhynchoides TaxID=125765 RepID=UPI003A997759